MAVEKSVAEHEGRGLVAQEADVVRDVKRLGEPVGARLFGVGEFQAEVRAVTQQPAEQRQILRCGDDQDLTDAGQHEHRQRVVDHRLVVDGHELLAHGDGQGEKAGAGAAGEDDAAAGGG